MYLETVLFIWRTLCSSPSRDTDSEIHPVLFLVEPEAVFTPKLQICRARTSTAWKRTTSGIPHALLWETLLVWVLISLDRAPRPGWPRWRRLFWGVCHLRLGTSSRLPWVISVFVWAQLWQMTRIKSEGGGTKGLKHVEGDVPTCLKTTNEGKTKEYGRKEVQRRSSSIMCLHPTGARKDLKEVTFTVLQKNTWSMNSSQRIEELFQEVQARKWDVILVSETWRSNEEVWESNQGHIVESGKFTNKHDVAIILHGRWRQKVNWVECVSERVIAASISVNKQPASTYMPHSGYPDIIKPKRHVIRRVTEKDKNL